MATTDTRRGRNGRQDVGAAWQKTGASGTFLAMEIDAGAAIGDALAALLGRYGYAVTRQKGSHLRLSTLRGSEHHLTVPRHRPLRVGTLAAIVKDVAEHLGEDRETIARELFG